MDIHLWLGLSSGLVVIAVCFSGTIYVWNTELTESAAPALYSVEVPVGASRLSADSLLKKISDSTGGTVLSMTIPASEDRTYQFQVKKKGDSTRGITHFVNPYTGEITGNSNSKTGTQKFMSNMFSLHRWLLLDKIGYKELGSTITGWATIIFTLGCITGLIIWFPRRLKNWKQGLKIKFTSNWKRVNHDLHNTLAFYALFFLLLMGLTGPQWSFPWYRTGLQKTLGTYKPPAPKDGEKKEKKREKVEVALLSINDYKKAADDVLPYDGDCIITLPSETSPSVGISKNKLGFFAPAAADRLTLDAATANVTKQDIFRDKPFNERIAGSIKAIHVGSVYGTFTKIIYFIACLIATTLPVTGTLIWLNKLKQRRRKGVKMMSAEEEEAVNA